MELREEVLKKYAIIRNLTDINGIIKEHEHIYMPKQMSLGVELEVIGAASNYLYGVMLDGFEGKEDITIRDKKYPGVEIISPILRSNNVDDVLGVAEQLKMIGMHTNKSCGGHIHIGADYLEVKEDSQKINDEATKYAWKSLLEMWKSNEEIMYKITNRVGEEHRGIRFAKPIAPKIEEMLVYDDTSMNVYAYKEMVKNEQTEKEPYVSERFFSLNFSNLNDEKDTLEFRLANGTIEPKELKANIELFMSFVDISKKIGIVRYKEKNKSKLTKKEEELLKKYKEICTNIEISEEEKKNKLFEIMFDDEKRQIYDERYEKSTFNLEEEMQKIEHKSNNHPNEYGAQLTDEELDKLRDYKKNTREKEEVKYTQNDLEESANEIPKERINRVRTFFKRIIELMQHHRIGKEEKSNKDDLER